MVVNFVFRLPRFPVLFDSGESLIAARSKAELAKAIHRLNIADDAKRNIIDLNGEGFAYYPKITTVTPNIGIRKWNKLQIIELYDARRRPEYPAMRRTSLGNRKLEEIVREAVELVLEDERSTRSKQGSM